MFFTGENKTEAAGRGGGALHGPGEGRGKGALCEIHSDIMLLHSCCSPSQASTCGQTLEKKQRILEKQLGDWKQKCEELVAEVEGCQKESRQYASELFKIKTVHEETLEQLEAVRRESKAYQGMRLGPVRTYFCGLINVSCIRMGLSRSW